MLLSLAVYAGMFGWPYAVGFIGLLFLHEMGHYVAAQQSGLNVGAPTFIPFVGAWIELKENPPDVETEAYVAFAGPFIGTLGAVACYFWGRETQDRTLLAIAYAGFFLNFFNLMPISPLDGGRITAIISPRIWFAGVPILIATFIYVPSPLLVLIGIASISSLQKAWHYDPTDPENARYYGVTTQKRLEYGAMYLGLVAYLGIMAYSTHELIPR
jgi:Zn-dependent protease